MAVRGGLASPKEKSVGTLTLQAASLFGNRVFAGAVRSIKRKTYWNGWACKPITGVLLRDGLVRIEAGMTSLHAEELAAARGEQ